MSEFIVKGKHFSTKHIWFETKIDNIGGGYDKLLIHGISQCDVALKDCISCEQETLISDLSCSEDELRAKMTKTIKNEINRCVRENVVAKSYEGQAITDDLLSEFATMYHEMYEEKEIHGHYLPISELKEYAKQKALIITTAEINNKVVVYHSYIKDDLHSRFLQSCSEFRVADSAMRNAIGRANKYLHWHDWLLLKNVGVIEYDWGGIASYDNPNGIDKFKMSFGGEYRKYYNISAVCSLRAKLYTLLRKVLRK